MIRREPLNQALPDLKEMIPGQWELTGDPLLPPDPNWVIYAKLEEMGTAALFVARTTHAIGYCTALLHPHVNAREIPVGTISTYHAEEGLLRAWVIRELLVAAKNWLLVNGAKQVFVETEYGHSAGPLLERMGFVPHKIGYRMAQEQGNA